MLRHKASFIDPGCPDSPSCEVTAVDYEQLTIDKLEDPQSTEDMLFDYAYEPQHRDTNIYLVQYLH